MATSADASPADPSTGGSSQQSSTDATTTTSSPTSTSSTPTPTTSPTSATPTPTTEQATTPTTSQAAAQSTTSSQSQVASGSTQAALTTTPAVVSSSTSTFTSQVATTLLSTNPAGSVVLYTTTVPEVVSTTISTSGSAPSSSSHTGVIVGSVVGGVAGLFLIIALLLCIRKRVRNDEFDGNFDPDHVGGRTEGGAATLPQVDFTDEVTPFPQPHADHGSANASMRQYGEPSYLALHSSPSGTSGQLSAEYYTHGRMDAQPQTYMQPGVASPAPPAGPYLPPMNMYSAGPADWHAPRPGTSPPPSTVSNGTSSTRAAKEREAARATQGPGLGLGLATQPEVGEGSGDVVVQHQDAGRAPSEEQAPPREIPPSYDSIRQD